jgi:hypothetical protein
MLPTDLAAAEVREDLVEVEALADPEAVVVLAVVEVPVAREVPVEVAAVVVLAVVEVPVAREGVAAREDLEEAVDRADRTAVVVPTDREAPMVPKVPRAAASREAPEDLKGVTAATHPLSAEAMNVPTAVTPSVLLRAGPASRSLLSPASAASAVLAPRVPAKAEAAAVPKVPRAAVSREVPLVAEIPAVPEDPRGVMVAMHLPMLAAVTNA